MPLMDFIEPTSEGPIPWPSDPEWDRVFEDGVSPVSPAPLLEQFDNAVSGITQERGKIYGPPRADFERIAALQAQVASCPDPAVRHALNMICVKLSRLVRSPDHLDSWIDIAGYARTGVMCLEERKP